MTDFQTAFDNYRARAELALAKHLPHASDAPARLCAAMEYACLNGGKRFRAALVYACGETAGADARDLDSAAAAVEMMHAYSLVHDDLPAMDDDDVRRGRPACHIAFDEATAILAGDALQSRAFETIANSDLPAARRARMLTALGDAAGACGMAGGQMLDIAAAGESETRAAGHDDIAQLAKIHRAKTGALIIAAARLGAYSSARFDDATSSDSSEKFLADLECYASHLGLAFQIADDVLDVTATLDATGKCGGGDRRMQKITYASALGVDGAKREAEKHCARAQQSAALLGDNAEFLMQLAKFAVARGF